MCSYSDKVNGMNGWSGFQDFPPDNEIKIDGGHHITCGQKRDVSITAMIVLAVQMANNAIGAASERSNGNGPTNLNLRCERSILCSFVSLTASFLQLNHESVTTHITERGVFLGRSGASFSHRRRRRRERIGSGETVMRRE